MSRILFDLWNVPAKYFAFYVHGNILNPLKKLAFCYWSWSKFFNRSTIKPCNWLQGFCWDFLGVRGRFPQPSSYSIFFSLFTL